MTCEQAKEQIADYLAGGLSASTSEDLREHFERCPGCKQEAEALSETWKMLGLLEQEHPSAAVRTRFYDSLDAYRQGVAAAPAPRTRGRWFDWAGWRWSGLPQVAWSVALLIIGVIGGQWLGNRQRGEGDLAKLQDEVQHMRQLVTLSLLQQQSASERLRGVDYAYRVEGSDTQVLSALLHAVNHDPNVNVRLAAVDALRRFSGSPIMHNTLDKALVKQDSPLVQIALIDLIVDTRDKGATPALRVLERRPDANKNVRERAVWGLSQLQ
ncbi:MAG: zf-HC2 domain-containing protein [Bryobacteraceae bacterium]